MNANDPKSREEVDRIVLEKLNDPHNPDNIAMYDLAGPGSIKEKAKVLWKGFVFITVFLILIVAGMLIDEKLLHINTDSFFSVGFFLLVGIGFLAYVPYVRWKLKRGIRK